MRGGLATLMGWEGAKLMMVPPLTFTMVGEPGGAESGGYAGFREAATAV